MPDRCILIILDGLGDRSFRQLNNLTPLQAARTPALDSLAARGANGLYHPAAFGQALPSELAHFLIFGYDTDEFPGRGPLEALGSDIPLGKDEVAILAHLAYIEAEEGFFRLAADDPLLDDEESRTLLATVGEFEKDGISCHLHPTKGRFGVLIMKGDVAPFITDTDPLRDGDRLIEVQPWEEHAGDGAAQKTAECLRAYLLWAHRLLSNNALNLARRQKGLIPVNALVTQRAGRLKAIPSFRTRYGLSGTSIASGLVYRGLAAYLEMTHFAVADSNDPGRDLARRLDMAGNMLDDFDFLHVHTKAPDQAANTKDPGEKLRVIESLDAGLGRAIEKLADDPRVLLVVTADHSTPSGGTLIHSGEPVPLLFSGLGIRRDGIDRYDEVSAAGGALGCLRGRELIYMILNYLDRAKLVGLRDTPADQPYWPGDYRPFKAIEEEEKNDD